MPLATLCRFELLALFYHALYTSIMMATGEVGTIAALQNKWRAAAV